MLHFPTEAAPQFLYKLALFIDLSVCLSVCLSVIQATCPSAHLSLSSLMSVCIFYVCQFVIKWSCLFLKQIYLLFRNFQRAIREKSPLRRIHLKNHARNERHVVRDTRRRSIPVPPTISVGLLGRTADKTYTVWEISCSKPGIISCWVVRG